MLRSDVPLFGWPGLHCYQLEGDSDRIITDLLQLLQKGVPADELAGEGLPHLQKPISQSQVICKYGRVFARCLLMTLCFWFYYISSSNKFSTYQRIAALKQPAAASREIVKGGAAFLFKLPRRLYTLDGLPAVLISWRRCYAN